MRRIESRVDPTSSQFRRYERAARDRIADHEQAGTQVLQASSLLQESMLQQLLEAGVSV